MEKFSLEFLSASKPATVADCVKKPRPRALSKFQKERERRDKKSQFDLPPATAAETKFRHGDWTEKREKVRATLVSIGTSEKTLERFDECGGDSFVYWSETQKRYSLRGNYCKNRHCVPCQRARGNRLAAALKSKLEVSRDHQYRFITLTLAHSDTPLKDQIKRLFSCFKTLRKTAAWQESQDGGAFTLEVKYQTKTRQWHPHLHIVAEGGFLRKETLSKEWKRITTDSHIVDIRVLDSGKDAAHYVAKYVAKGTTDNVWDDLSLAQEWVTAMKGVRICSTYGTWRGYKLMARPEIADDWTPIASLTRVIQAAADGNEWAKGVMLNLRPPGITDRPATPPLADAEE